MEDVMSKLLILTAAILITVGFAIAKTDYARSTDQTHSAMPSIHKMMSEAKDLPVQSFAAY